MQYIKRIHRAHHVYENDTSLISFNPEKTSSETMFREQYTVVIKPINQLEFPKEGRCGKIMAIESKLASSGL